MKNVKMLLVIAVVLNCFIGDARAGNDPITIGLESFYSYYIRENSKEPLSTNVSNDTMKKYCSMAFLKKMRNDKELEADPIVHAQDFDPSWLKTLRVKKLNAANGLKYEVCFLDVYQKKDHCIMLFLVKEAGQWKINKTCNGGYCY